VRIWHDRVAQLDLDTDDRMEPDRLRRRHESDRAVQPAMVGHGETGQAELDRALNEILGSRRSVEEREVGVAVQFGVCRRGHDDS
jgi:hypothetical protein